MPTEDKLPQWHNGPIGEDLVDAIFEISLPRQPSNVWLKIRRMQRVMDGLCVNCGIPKGDSPTQNCQKCREYLAQKSRNNKRKRKAKQPKPKNPHYRRVFCRKCADIHNEYRKGLRPSNRCERCLKHRRLMEKKRKTTNA